MNAAARRENWTNLLGPFRGFSPDELDRVRALVIEIRHAKHACKPLPPESCFECLDLEQVRGGARRYSWACVGIGAVKDVSDVWVVKVLEDAGHQGPVTWNRKNGQKFATVLGPVREYRSEAREDRARYLKEHKLSNAQREAQASYYHEDYY